MLYNYSKLKFVFNLVNLTFCSTKYIHICIIGKYYSTLFWIVTIVIISFLGLRVMFVVTIIYFSRIGPEASVILYLNKIVLFQVNCLGIDVLPIKNLSNLFYIHPQKMV